MSYIMTEEDELIQQNANEFSEEYLAPIAADIDKNNEYPQEAVEQLAENGFFGLCFPEEYSGAGTSYMSYILALQEIAAKSGGVAAILMNHISLAGCSINKWGTDEQKEKYLTPLCTGESIGAFAWSEKDAAPGAGADALTAERNGTEFVLNGKKCYVANGGIAGIYIVAAVTGKTEKGNSFSLFIVPADTPGFRILRSIDKMGLKACPWAEIVFDDCHISEKNLLGKENEGLSMVQEAYLAANVAEGAVAIGIMQAAFDEASDYAQNRVQFNRAIVSFPAIQNMLAGIAKKLYFSRLAVYDAAGKMSEGEPFFMEAASIKSAVSEAGTQSMIDAVQVEGGYGYCEDMSVSRLYRDINGLFFTESTADFAEPVIVRETI